MKDILGPNLIEEPSYRDKIHIFEDRTDAGRQLAARLIKYKNTNTLVLGIASGGIPVALEIKKSLDLQMDLLLVRKIQIPWNTEAGFGAMDPDGGIILNKDQLKRLNLTRDEIELQQKKTRKTLKERNRLFRRDKPFPDIKDRVVIIADDGLASGYTMLAAMSFVKKRRPEKIIAAVPTGSRSTVELILRGVDELVCLNVRTGFPYAVADAYRNWHDLTEKEVKGLL
jgi:predicted phosphoribosyltransferase